MILSRMNAKIVKTGEDVPRRTKIHRREFIASIPVMIAGVGVSSCVSRIEQDQKDYCKGNKENNRQVCRQLDIQKNYIAELTLAVIIGASIGAAVGFAINRKPVQGALIGAALAGTVAVTKKYVDLKLKQANGDARLAMAAVKSDIERDNEYTRNTIEDLKKTVASLKKTSADNNIKLSSKIDELLKYKVTVATAEKNIRALKEANDGYRHLIEVKLLPEVPGVVKESGKLEKKVNEAPAYLGLLKKEISNAEK